MVLVQLSVTVKYVRACQQLNQEETHLFSFNLRLRRFTARFDRSDVQP